MCSVGGVEPPFTLCMTASKAIELGAFRQDGILQHWIRNSLLIIDHGAVEDSLDSFLECLDPLTVDQVKMV